MDATPCLGYRHFITTASRAGRSITTVDIVPAPVAGGETLLLPEAIGRLLGALARNRAPPISERRLIFGLNIVLLAWFLLLPNASLRDADILFSYGLRFLSRYFIDQLCCITSNEGSPLQITFFFPFDFKHATQKLRRS